MPWKHLGCLALAVFVLFLALALGSSQVQAWDFFKFMNKNVARDAAEWQFWQTVIFSIRLPRVLVAALCGGSLAAAGALSQALFRNPLASPTVLGISSGSICVLVGFYAFSGSWLPWYLAPLLAFAGAVVALGLLVACVQRFTSWAVEQLLLVGVAFSSLWGALTSLLLSLHLHEQQKLAAMLHWLLGGFSGVSWDLALWSLPFFVLGLWGAWRLGPHLDVLALGEAEAQTLSVDVARLKRQLILIIALLVAAAVSVAGTLPFVCLVVPHLTRLVFGPRLRTLLLFSVINGMSLTVFADLLGRTLIAPLEIEVGVFTALLGAPFFLMLLLQRKTACSR